MFNTLQALSLATHVIAYKQGSVYSKQGICDDLQHGSQLIMLEKQPTQVARAMITYLPQRLPQGLPISPGCHP